MRPKWLGYVSIWNYHTKSIELLELPIGACKDLVELHGRKDKMRGVRLTVKRGNASTARIKFTPEVPWEKIHEGKKMPQPLDAEKCMRALWQINETKLKLHWSDGIATDQETA